jgi:hypothetical protein
MHDKTVSGLVYVSGPQLSEIDWQVRSGDEQETVSTAPTTQYYTVVPLLQPSSDPSVAS